MTDDGLGLQPLRQTEGAGAFRLLKKPTVIVSAFRPGNNNPRTNGSRTKLCHPERSAFQRSRKPALSEYRPPWRTIGVERRPASALLDRNTPRPNPDSASNNRAQDPVRHADLPGLIQKPIIPADQRRSEPLQMKGLSLDLWLHCVSEAVESVGKRLGLQVVFQFEGYFARGLKPQIIFLFLCTG